MASTAPAGAPSQPPSSTSQTSSTSPPTSTPTDIASLTPTQALALQQFTAVTASDHNTAVPLLQRCQWNVQIAIARFFDGEPAENPVAAAQAAAAAAPPPQDRRRQETLAQGFGSTRSTSSSRRSTLDPAPRVVPQPESTVTTQVPLVLALLWAPLSLLYSLAAKSLRLLGFFFPFLPRVLGRLTATNIRSSPGSSTGTRSTTSGRRPLNPRDTAARFIREFDEEYGAHTLPFYEGGYASAFDAAKSSLRFLLVILLSPEHDDTAPWVRSTLLSPEVSAFLREHTQQNRSSSANDILLWAGTLADPEAYAVSTALGASTSPFCALIVHTPPSSSSTSSSSSVSSSTMSIAARIPGTTTPAQLLSKIRAAMERHAEPLARVRAQQAERDASRRVREEQDSAYARSLATDRARAERKREEAARVAAEEKAALEAERRAEEEREKRKKWRKWRAARVRGEPGAGEDGAVRVSLRMRDGDRVVRRFAGADGVEEVFAFVECYDLLNEGGLKGEKEMAAEKPQSYEHTYAFRLVSPMPRTVYTVEEGGTIGARIGRSANLIVEPIREDDEDEEEEEDSSD